MDTENTDNLLFNKKMNRRDARFSRLSSEGGDKISSFASMCSTGLTGTNCVETADPVVSILKPRWSDRRN